eukprot:CAMPEP_0174318098 /NCGR_PEP_ID=MMETSP0810-20121108/7991_1 /TAXON_ID=73025 ORGANISM="Eutreptiella gymnastica-like, Strain CCMP1594" /NCGR_SAMPLE_ID=MMETSP0810 /ASSEMBLY_ACC=CAM_ASM_000659 /LENGTH=867 /DNA_ID=CAMNT_0015428233 /DNA_START=18 /DNA_END=2621 /DNA_ORIENTATION=-
MKDAILTHPSTPPSGGSNPLEGSDEPAAALTDSLFKDVAMAPPDPILGVTQAFKACESADKLNLGVGAYRSEEGKPWVLPTVKAAEAKLLELQEAGAINKEYLPIDGIPEFYSAALKLMLGDDCTPLKEGRVCSVQCLSGTGGLRLAAACIGQFQKGASIYVPNPTWGNHNKIFPREGVPVKSYTYYKPETCGLDFEGMCADLNAMPSGSVVLLHACAHNPTGVDPTEEQWAEIASIVKKRGLVPLIDSAYQGFASGDFDKDAWACRYFAEQGMELYLVQSFAKNMGLYGERTGVLSIICQDQDNAARLKSQIKPFIRTMYSSPPQHGARIAELILNDPQQLEAWKAEVKVMADRIIKMRQLLYQELKANECPGEWEHVINQIGMFTFTGLTPEQVDVLTQKYSIFLTKDGRISMAGLREEKCKYLADAMKDAILTHPSTPPSGGSNPLEGSDEPAAALTDSLFKDVAMAPPDPILGVTQAFKACESADKLNLGVGAYRSEEGKPWVLPTVKAAEAKLLELQEAGAINKEYLPIDGIPEFYSAALKLMLGDDCTPLKEGRVCSVQCLSGTGGLRLAAACIGQFQKGASIYVPNPTWGNHNKIFPREGVPVKSYTYYKPETCGLDFEGMCADLNAMPSGSVVLLHACAHNPTGVDPTEEQWAEIASIVKKRGLVPLIDSAYQGFASGDFDKDAWACRYFAEQGMELYLVQSFAKNMGLYGERTGVLSIICQDQDNAARLKSQIKPFIRTMYSSPPQHGARIAELILNDPQQLEAWKAEVKVMADRIIKMRQLLYQELKANECPGEWEHVINQIGMFTFTGLTPEQVDVLTQKYSIFLTKDGRISMAGLREEKCKYLADAMKDAILTHP